MFGARYSNIHRMSCVSFSPGCECLCVCVCVKKQLKEHFVCAPVCNFVFFFQRHSSIRFHAIRIRFYYVIKGDD